MKPKVYLSGDHAGFKLKEKIKIWLQKKGFEVSDFGPIEYNKDDDYPDFTIPMALAVTVDKSSPRGIIIAGSGEGEAIAVNKINGIRAGVYHGKNIKVVKVNREHNDANILCIGARFVDDKEAKRAIEMFIKTKFQGGRHLRRLKKFERLGS